MYDITLSESLGTNLNWQQAEDVASFRQCNLASVIADRISGPMGQPEQRR